MNRSRSDSLTRLVVAAAVPIVIAGTALMVLVRFAGGLRPTEVPTLLLRVAGGVVVSAVVIVSIIVTARLTQLPCPAWLSPADGRWRGFLAGVLAWTVPATLAFAALALVGVRLSVDAEPGQVMLIAGLVLLAVLLSEALPEELLFRGWLTDVLSRRLTAGWTIALQSAIFAGCGLALRGWTGTLDASMLVAMGVGLGYLRFITQNVWTSVGFHASFQTGSQLVLTHEVVGFSGSALQGAVALGMVPFGIACAVVALVAPARPTLFRRDPCT